jgi:uncharacterized protein involved in exopolysaccharide biosynthesis
VESRGEAEPPISDEIDLRNLLVAIWRGKWLVVASMLLFSVAAVFYSLSLPNIYKSEVLLAPVTEESGLKLPGQLGGLASLAGVNLGGNGGDKTGLAIEILKSREFIGRFVQDNDLYVPLMAATGWDRATNTLLINSEVYDVNSKKWVRKVEIPFEPKPSNMEAYEEFKKIFSVNEDKQTGMIKLSIEYYSPLMAKAWVDSLVMAINENMRKRELNEAERSIDYLNSKIEKTTIADVRSMLFSLIEEQTKTAMLANVRDEYVFKTVDPAVVAERKVGPKRAFIVILSMLVGLMLSAFIVIVHYFNRR